jgi:CBS domain-containing protein
MRVSEIMHKGVTTVQIHDSIKKVASIMKREDIGSVPVFKNERPVGFVTDRDLVISSLASGHAPDAPVSQAMTRDLIYVYEDEDIHQAANVMKEKKISRLLVMDRGDRPSGMISLHDVAEYTDDTELKADMITKIKRS